MPTQSSGPLTVAVVGATGAVGRTMMQVLLERDFPFAALRPLASARSAGSTLAISGHRFTVAEARPESFDGVDIALFSAGATASGTFAPLAAQAGAVVIDNSSRWRMEPGIPLVVPEVNGADAAGHEGLIANPNCSTMQLVPLLAALRDAAGLERVVVDTYQAVSGSGHKAVAELQAQVEAHVAGRPSRPRSTPTPSPSTPCRRSTSSSRTATRARNGRSSTRVARSSTCPTCGSPARPFACRSSPATRKRSTSSCAIR